MTSSYRIRQLAEMILNKSGYTHFMNGAWRRHYRYIRLMISRFLWLAENLQLGKRRDDVKHGYYSFPEGKHVIFYTITKSGIDIIGIPHQRMDIISYLE